MSISHEIFKQQKIDPYFTSNLNINSIIIPKGLLVPIKKICIICTHLKEPDKTYIEIAQVQNFLFIFLSIIKKVSKHKQIVQHFFFNIVFKHVLFIFF